MRPCRQCRTPIENRAVTCPQCGTAQTDAPKPNSDPLPPRSRRKLAHELLTGLFDLTGLALVLVPVGTVLLLAGVGAVGYFIAGQTGAAVGVVGAITLALGVVVWAESGG